MPKAARVSIFAASEKTAKQVSPPTVTPDPSISFNDVVIVLKKDLDLTELLKNESNCKINYCGKHFDGE